MLFRQLLQGQVEVNEVDRPLRDQRDVLREGDPPPARISFEPGSRPCVVDEHLPEDPRREGEEVWPDPGTWRWSHPPA